MGVDKINPSHYQEDGEMLQCNDVNRYLPNNLGNAFKYIWRWGTKKGEPLVDDLGKCIWYLEHHPANVFSPPRIPWQVMHEFNNYVMRNNGFQANAKRSFLLSQIVSWDKYERDRQQLLLNEIIGFKEKVNE